ncbi:MAG: sulfotransferase [Pseudomonadota bacterium]
MTGPAEFRAAIDETLALLAPFTGAAKGAAPTEPLSDLIRQCEAASATIEARPPEPVRTLHHFACTGGTLISRCLQAQPNTLLLSEIDPFSAFPRETVAFAPYDLLKQAQTSLRPLADGIVEDVFLSGVKEIYEASRTRAQRVIIRDHTHSHFCTHVDPASRPLIGKVLERRFNVKSLVTVRHPLDSFLSLRKNGWVHFSPDTLDDYCRRYDLFLDSYPDAPIVRYEDFVADPDAGARLMCETLALSYTESWLDVLPAVRVSGDSGRKSVEIELRPRRAIDDDLLSEAAKSKTFAQLCDRLGYAADTAAPPLEREAPPA